jgi:zinc protease
MGCRLLGLAAVVALVCFTTAAAPLRLPPHENVVLKNGLIVLLLEKHGVPLINISAIVKTGSAADPAGQEGLAAITAGLLRKGSKKRTAQQFAADLDFMGAAFEAEAGVDFTGVHGEFLSKDVDRAGALF